MKRVCGNAQINGDVLLLDNARRRGNLSERVRKVAGLVYLTLKGKSCAVLCCFRAACLERVCVCVRAFNNSHAFSCTYINVYLTLSFASISLSILR